MAAAHGIEYLSSKNADGIVDVGNQASPQMVYFGTEAHSQDVARFVIPHEVIGGFFFLVIALAMVGPGQELGRALNRVPNRLQAYTVNIPQVIGSNTAFVGFTGGTGGLTAVQNILTWAYSPTASTVPAAAA